MSLKCGSVFDHLKSTLTFRPLLCHLDEAAPTLLHTNISGHSIGAVLLQQDNYSCERVVAYVSHVLTNVENYTIREQDSLAIVWSVQKFHP